MFGVDADNLRGFSDVVGCNHMTLYEGDCCPVCKLSNLGFVISSCIHWVSALARLSVQVAVRWYRTGIGDLAAGVTFWILVSLPASVLALLAALGPLDSVVDGFGFQSRLETEVINFTARVFTDESGSIERAIQELFQQGDPGLFTVSLGLTLWSISRGFAGLMRSLDDIYEVEERRTWYHARVVGLLLGLGSLAMSVPLIVTDQLVWGAIPDGLFRILMRNLFALCVLALWASTIYHFGTGQRSRWRLDLPGACVAAVMWWGLSVGFSRYGVLTSGSNQVRAAVGAGLLALTWLWLVAQILLIGGAVNFLVGERLGVTRRRSTLGLNEKLNETIASTTDELKRIVEPGNSRSRD